MIYYKNEDNFSLLAAQTLKFFKYNNEHELKGISYPNSDYFLGSNETYILVGLPKVNLFNTNVIYVNPFVEESMYKTDSDYKNTLTAIQNTLGIKFYFDNIPLSEIANMLVGKQLNTLDKNNSFFKYIYRMPTMVSFGENEVYVSSNNSDLPYPQYSLYDYNDHLIAIGTQSRLKQEDILRLNKKVDALITFDLSANRKSCARYIDNSNQKIAQYFLSEHGFKDFKETNNFGYGTTDINLDLILGIEGN